LLVCFLLGLLVRTALGSWLFMQMENRLLKRIPLYSIVKEAVQQLIGQQRSPFGQVALVQAYGDGGWQTAFVTDTHDTGWLTVFIPTGPNPTSGMIFHLPPQRVRMSEMKTDNAMRSVISCGAGSAELVKSLPQS